jgi:hypothetical protein
MTNKVKQFFENNTLDENDLIAIFGDQPDFSDEYGWRALTGITYENGDYIGFFIDQEGAEFDNIIYLTDEEKEYIDIYVTNKYCQN